MSIQRTARRVLSALCSPTIYNPPAVVLLATRLADAVSDECSDDVSRADSVREIESIIRRAVSDPTPDTAVESLAIQLFASSPVVRESAIQVASRILSIDF